MSKKFSAQRKRAFLTYLAQSGNQTLSAERAKVSRSWVQLHRSTDPEFDAACREAIEEAKSVLRYAASSGSNPGSAAPQDDPSIRPCGATQAERLREKWAYQDGVELAVAGTGGSGGGKRVQVRRARVKQWTPRVEKRFLAALGATCNVKAACAEVGMWPPSAYNHRKRWPAFARRWEEAIETGYARLEAALVEAGCNMFRDRTVPRTLRFETFSSPEIEPDFPIPMEQSGCPPDVRIISMTAAEALQLLNMHKHEVRGVGRKPGLQPRYPTEEELCQRLEAKMRALRMLKEEE